MCINIKGDWGIEARLLQGPLPFFPTLDFATLAYFESVKGPTGIVNVDCSDLEVVSS